MFREIRLQSLAYLGFNSIDEIDRMTLSEYYLRLEAYRLRKLDREEEIAIQAWFNQTVQNTTGGKHPKPKFKKFTEFFDRASLEKNIRDDFADDYSNPYRKPSKKEQSRVFITRYREFKQLKAEGRIDPKAWKRERGD
ncbi:hypothetical protein [Limosilactobacillus urinaemulieris]|uniref:hypothetical protein n=1 Tax=Limosilactobacillus urinaemulieris TaxID=2742600 RepID=UPI0028EAD523|nr:hypothetical protein [Limosilactobacillus urinaemulieris]